MLLGLGIPSASQDHGKEHQIFKAGLTFVIWACSFKCFSVVAMALLGMQGECGMHHPSEALCIPMPAGPWDAFDFCIPRTV